MTTPTSETITVPRAGMLATIRNRRGVVAAIEPFDGETGRLHLTTVSGTPRGWNSATADSIATDRPAT